MSGIQKEILLVSSGDLRLAANQICWAEQEKAEQLLTIAVDKLGYSLKRAHAYDAEKKHGFIDSQKMGIEVFRNIDPTKPIIVLETLWQYTHHVLAGLFTHQGPILTMANWSGTAPGLVGMLNLNGSLTKAGVQYSTLWSERFNDTFFEAGLNEWLLTGSIKHDQSHVQNFDTVKIPLEDEMEGRAFARQLKSEKAIMGVFDEGCMGMYNAIVPDELLHPTGFFKERLSQATLYAAMQKVSRDEAVQVLTWLLEKGMKFNWGSDDKTELTENQTIEQCKMYIAATRIASEFGCKTIGIQYQQGLKDLTVASDLVEGLLNNQDRPPVFSETGEELYAGEALPHFNEVDECAGIDALLTYQLWKHLGMPGENTLHDLRWGEHYQDENTEAFVWVFLISGAVPAAHLIDGYKGASSERQPTMYFHLGGGSLKGISKPGHIVWSRVYIMDNKLHCDIGVGESVLLPEAETQRRWQVTTPQWPIMHGVLKGVSRDQMMARHKANHIHVVYTNDEASAHRACRIKAAAMAELGLEVHFCGDISYKG
ncbi:fucose isomerase [Mucilaginibacter paludis]|uniref:L-fucose isomerase_2 domain-containing protein n=1 Tax=Mucilaginibacter paludis DSM 18603 TaxID=714943 RepID=H1YEQ5_9SPHI|nr:fucose isomerase [Mucilaginibacter paludis]EHQ30815.1 L-fucose isomerase_2 domain-containing protein [Mucilaginibacter paludis DSM 18603]